MRAHFGSLKIKSLEFDCKLEIGNWKFRSETAAATTGPQSGPRPTSSVPIIISNPFSAKIFSSSNVDISIYFHITPFKKNVLATCVLPRFPYNSNNEDFLFFKKYSGRIRKMATIIEMDLKAFWFFLSVSFIFIPLSFIAFYIIAWAFESSTKLAASLILLTLKKINPIALPKNIRYRDYSKEVTYSSFPPTK